MTLTILGGRAWLALLLAVPVAVQDDVEPFAIGKDRYLAGSTVIFDGVGADDLFIAGATVRVESDISGSAHMAARGVDLVGEIGGDAYLAGMNLELSGRVAGDAMLASYEARVGDVDGDLRSFGRKLVVEGQVAGSAMINGHDVRIEGPILGDVHLMCRELSFANGARIDGELVLFERDPGELSIPASVAREDQIERRALAEWGDSAPGEGRTTWTQRLLRLLIQAAVFAGLATLAAAIVPRKVTKLRRMALGSPGRTLLRGFFTESALFGSCILFFMTPMGFVLVPFVVLAAFVLGASGYVVGVYALGVGLWLAFGRPEPDGLGTKALAAVLGALVARSISLVPYVGQLAFLALTLTGVGAFTLRWLRPPAALESAT